MLVLMQVLGLMFMLVLMLLVVLLLMLLSIHKILTDTNEVIYRSAVCSAIQSALATDQHNPCIDPVEGETQKLIEII
jgi:hypothetical protein